MLTDEGVKNVAPCYHCTSVRVGNKDDDLYSRARKRTDLQASTKWRGFSQLADRQQHNIHNK
jgi:hypothetical protein